MTFEEEFPNVPLISETQFDWGRDMACRARDVSNNCLYKQRVREVIEQLREKGVSEFNTIDADELLKGLGL